MINDLESTKSESANQDLIGKENVLGKIGYRWGVAFGLKRLKKN